MRIAIDINDAGGVARGGTHFINRLLSVFSRTAPDREFLLFGNAFKDPEKIRRQFPLPPGRFSYEVKRWPQRLVAGLEEAGVPLSTGYLALRGVDVHHDWVGHAGSGDKVAQVVADLTIITHPQWNNPARLRYWKGRLKPAILKARRLMTFCRATRDELVEQMGISEERIRIVPLGADPATFKPISDAAALAAARAKYGLPERFVLMVGPIDVICAFAAVVEALKDWPGEPPSVVVVGPVDEYVQGLRRLVEESGLAESFVWTGYVPHSELGLLYNLAAALLHPSLLPGTEMPPYEAMASGTPVVTSLDETIADAGVLIDAKSPVSIRDGLRRVWEAESVRTSLRSKGLARARDYTWESTARETLKVYDEIAGANH